MALGYLDDSKLYAIASAIRAKTGDSATMTVDDMPDEIGSISTGAQVEPLSVTENGTYAASAGHAYSPVTVSVSGGGGLTMDDVATRNFGSEIYIPTANEISAYAFFSYIAGTSPRFTVSAPNVVRVMTYAFGSCTRLTAISIPKASDVSGYAFNNCSSLASVYAPLLKVVRASAFFGCRSLSQLSLPNVSSIGNSAFTNCFKLISLDLTGVSSVPVLNGSKAFNSTPIGGYSASAGRFGSVYVPSSLYASFTAAQYWSLITSRIVSV